MKYDLETCVSAGELRSGGIDIEPDIPDCAWIPRKSIDINFDAAKKGSLERVFDLTYTIIFTEPFRWVHIDGVIDLSKGE